MRLTLLYSGLFTACGVILVAITYGLLAGNLPDGNAGGDTNVKQSIPPDFAADCAQATSNPYADPALLYKCKAAYQEGVKEGATSQRQATLDQLLRYSVGTLAAVTLLATVAGWIVAGRVLRPVHRITEAARNASEERLGARVGLTGPRDELRELADTFDDMLDRLQAAFEDQRRFIANAGHELRTPLAVMRTAVDVVLAKPEPTRQELVDMGGDVRTAVGHAQALIDALLTLARTDRGQLDRETVDLATVTEDAIDATAPAAGAAELQTSLAPAPARGDPILLERLAANLVDNAMRYNVPDGTVWVRTGTDGLRSVLTVDNTGPLLAPASVDKLFEPFRRLRDRTGDGGFGLGLAIVKSIATAHGGQAVAVARPEGGLSVTVVLPAR
ncbi:HAMP domain-containing histidine kinase [Actinoplanes sp. TBRC 11911]|uniref:sensor histidine kinase n=1 Tax=Actinoplanes sp. TBRC 11911 TaxID=2729386 RepID=UPI00145D88CB|nr:HAMP domain-containing sensor histidine kinase [Actinoplanes sp. TBRC 11911]NMO50001.1 HAMP domain-containing histidine kinase [Actinoplanes sp. TBRC 11911]